MSEAGGPGGDAGSAGAARRKQQDLDAMVAEIWQRMRPTVYERVDLIEAAAAAGADETTVEEARSAAHKLAGSLGMYGFPAASDAARDAELLLSTSGEVDRPALREAVEQLRAALDA